MSVAAPAPPAEPTDEGMRDGTRWAGTRRVGRATRTGLRAGVGVASFGAVLSAVAAVPGGAALALGWMLEAEGRASGEHGGDGNGGDGDPPRLGPLLGASATLAAVAGVVWLATVPVRLAAGVAADAAVIAPGSSAAAGWRLGMFAAAVAVTVHLALWLLGGGRTGWFRPLRNAVRVARDPRGRVNRLGERAAGLWQEFAPVRSLWLGVRGLVVALAWLLVPSVLLANQGGEVAAGVGRAVGAVWLIAVLPLVAPAQANLAAARRAGPWRSVRAGLSPRRAWRAWRRRPARWAGVLLAVGAGSLPLYFLAIVELPADAAWLVTPACVAAVLPGRLLAGWTRRNLPAAAKPGRWWAGAWLVAGWVLAAAYVGALFLTQFTAADGPAAVVRQPGFLTPVPFRVGG